MVYNYLLEFKALWELSKSDIKNLRDPIKCVTCGQPFLNIMLMEQEGCLQTKKEESLFLKPKRKTVEMNCCIGGN